MVEVNVHPRVRVRHPGISDEDAIAAWKNALTFKLRVTSDKDFYIAVGFDGRGRLLEVVVAQEDDGSWLIFHAMTPPTKRTLRELRMKIPKGGWQ